MTPSTQIDMFNDPIPASRKTDPDSSHIAEKEGKDSGRTAKQREEVYDMVRKYPFATARELAAEFGYDRYAISRRLPDLEKLGLVQRAGSPGNPLLRECKVGGRPSCVWAVKGRI